MAEQKVVGLTPNPPDPDDWVEIEHDDIEGTTRVHPRTLLHWQAREWRVVERDVEGPVTVEQEAIGDTPTVETPPAITTKKSARTADPGTEG